MQNTQLKGLRGVRLAVAAAIAASLGACTVVGPDFVAPTAAAPQAWQKHVQDGGPSVPTDGAVDVAWWHSFHDAQLDSLVQRAMASNLDIKIAGTRLLESRWARSIVDSASMPQVGANASFTRVGAAPVARLANSDEVLPGVAGTGAVNLYRYGFDASWELDFWGRTKRAVESADAQGVQAAEAQHGVILQVLTETAADYVQLRATQATLASITEVLQLSRKSLALTQARRAEGAATQLEVSEAAAQVGTIEAQLPDLEEQQGRLMNALALLLAENPGALAAELSTVKPIPPVPAAIPLGLPSELARRRPDIRRAEAQLHAATASIGVAKADFYPSITLMGSVSMNPMSSGGLGDWDSRRFSIGPALNLPIFQGGRLTGTVKLREAQQQEAAVLYQKTVLNAWHEIDDALIAYGTTQRRRAILTGTLVHNRMAYEAALARYKGGAATFLDVLLTQRSLLDAQTALVRSAADVSLAAIRVYKSLGGGWEQGAPA